MTSALSLLKAGRETLASGGPKAWTQGTFAKSGRGGDARRVEPWAYSATCWCAVGALYKAHGSWHLTGPPIKAWGALDAACPGIKSASFFNDSPDTKFPDIIALYDRAISALEKETTT